MYMCMCMYMYMYVRSNFGLKLPLSDLMSQCFSDMSQLLCYACDQPGLLSCDLCGCPMCGAHSMRFALTPRGGHLSTRICVPCDFADESEVDGNAAAHKDDVLNLRPRKQLYADFDMRKGKR